MTWTGLHDAVEHRDISTVIQRARSNSEEAIRVDDHGSTPLHVACERNPHLDIVNALIAACPQAATSQDVHGDTPLHVALGSRNANSDVIEALLKANPTASSVANREGLMPLHKLCRYDPGNHDVMEMLLEAYPSALRTPIKMGDPAPVKHAPSLEQRKETDHFILSTSPQSSMELRFREMGTQIRDGAYPLHMAIASKAPLQTVEMLVHAAPDVLVMTNKFGETPLHVALASEAPTEVVEHLLCNPEEKEDQPPTTETLCGSAALSITEKRHGNLPIHVAAVHGCNVAVALLMVELKPETVLVKNHDGLTPYELAVQRGRCDQDVLRLWKADG